MTDARVLARRVGGRVVRRARAALTDRRTGPTVVFARVLDGDHLWLAVGGVPSGTTFALDVPGQGVVPLVPELVEDIGEAGGGVAVRADLLDLPLPVLATGAELAMEVVAVAPGGGHTPVLTPPLPDTAPMRTPVSTRGWWQHRLDRDPRGRLVLHRAALEPWATLCEVGATEAGLTARVTVPPRAGAVAGATLVTDSGSPVDVAERGGEPISATAQHGFVAVRVGSSVRLEDGQSARLALLTRGTRQPLLVRRPHNALAAPDFSVVLPELHDGVDSALRWRFLPDGTLGVLRPERGAA